MCHGAFIHGVCDRLVSGSAIGRKPLHAYRKSWRGLGSAHTPDGMSQLIASESVAEGRTVFPRSAWRGRSACKYSPRL